MRMSEGPWVDMEDNTDIATYFASNILDAPGSCIVSILLHWETYDQQCHMPWSANTADLPA